MSSLSNFLEDLGAAGVQWASGVYHGVIGY